MTEKNHLVLLQRIAEFIIPLNPPVQAFEKSIRSSPFRVLISVLLSARTRDEVTGKASANLFNLAETPAKMLLLGEEKISNLIYPVGFYRQKAKNIYQICQKIAHSGKVPVSFEGLIALPGVGRKTANLVLSLAFNKATISVDIHVFRISKRLAWASGEKPEIVEEELKQLFPKESWHLVNQTLVGFGQTVCKPQNPNCRICVINKNCPYYNRLPKR